MKRKTKKISFQLTLVKLVTISFIKPFHILIQKAVLYVVVATEDVVAAEDDVDTVGMFVDPTGLKLVVTDSTGRRVGLVRRGVVRLVVLRGVVRRVVVLRKVRVGLGLAA